MNNQRFALIGAAGFVAPRHMKAIKEVGGDLVAAVDPHDSVGILDSYSKDVDFFTEFERFDRHVDKLRRKGRALDYVSICSPNYLHDSHIRFALRSDANAICEKPTVLNPWNLDALEELEYEACKKVFTVLQLRLHPSLLKLKSRIGESHKVKLRYITPRGNWYWYSWKGEESKSGGILSNIGIHLFDMLIWLFGDVECTRTTLIKRNRAKGTLVLKRAEVDWLLSVESTNMEKQRFLMIDDEIIDFSNGFENLHTSVYQNILTGNATGLEDARPSIELIHRIKSEYS